MIQAVVFDLGEVLASPPSLLPGHAARLGVEESALRAHYWDGRPDYDAGSSDADYWGPLLERLGVDATQELIDETARYDASCWSELRSTARQLLRDVRGAGTTVAILSNAPVAMKVAADTAPWREDVHHLFISGTLGFVKPDHDIYRHVERKLGLEGREIAFVDDRLPNVEAAAELGWQAHHWVSDADTRVWLVGLGVI